MRRGPWGLPVVHRVKTPRPIAGGAVGGAASGLDGRFVLAMFTLGSVFLYSFVLLLREGAVPEVPSWMVAMAPMILGYYFGVRDERNRAAATAADALVAQLAMRASDLPAEPLA